MGRVLSENGDYANAIKAFQNAYALSQEMIKADVDNAEIVRSAGSVSYTHLNRRNKTTRFWNR